MNVDRTIVFHCVIKCVVQFLICFFYQIIHNNLQSGSQIQLIRTVLSKRNKNCYGIF